MVFRKAARRDLTADSTGVDLVPAGEGDKEVFKNLLSLYMHDLSEYTGNLETADSGRFEYQGIELYWQQEELIPLLVHYNGRLVGFILFHRPPYTPQDTDYNVHEFFILRSYRGRGIGSAAIEKLFELHPGRYYVVQLNRNVPAIAFWHALYARLNIDYEERQQTSGGDTVLVQKFTV